MEGFACFEPPEACNPNGDLVLPIIAYDRETGRSVTGGYRFRGSLIPELVGRYVFADFATGKIFVATEVAPGNWQTTLAADTRMQITTFGEDEAGELYFADFNAPNGRILRIESVQASAQPAVASDGPTNLSNGGDSSGCFIESLLKES